MQRPNPATLAASSHAAADGIPAANHADTDSAAVSAPSPRRWRWIGLALVICALAWIALGVGIWMKVSTATMFVLATLAAVTTEGTVWLAALMLGVNAYQARRQLWQKLRRLFH